MKNTVKALLGVCCVLALLLAFTACQPTETPTQAPTAKPTDAAGTEATATPAPDAVNYMKPGEDYRILIWANMIENDWVKGEGPRGPEIRNRWLNFQEENGVTVTYVASTKDWLNDCLNSAIAGEPSTDIFNLGGPFAIPLAVAAGGMGTGTYLADLSLYKDGANFQDAEYWDIETQKIAGYYGGRHLIAIPLECRLDSVSVNQVTFFNNTLLEQGGHSGNEIKELYKKGEWTFEKFREIAKDCTDIDKEIYGTCIAQNGMAPLSLIHANGGNVLTLEEGSSVPSFAADSDEALYAINFFLKMCIEDKSVYTTGGVHTEEPTLFAAGKIALMLSYVNRVGSLEGTDIDFGIVLPPKGPDAEDYISDRNWFGPYCVFKDSPVVAGAVQCLSTYCRSEMSRNSEENIDALKADAQKYFKDGDSIDVLLDAMSHTLPTPYMIYWSFTIDGQSLGVLTIYNIDKWISGETTPEVEYQASKPLIDELLKQTYGLKDN